jgi:hydrogenase assembly chaperone HypC/HupF
VTLEPEHCLTCGDVAVAARVVEVAGSTALVEAEGAREHVAIELVEPVTVGELLLCHAGIAIEKLG